MTLIVARQKRDVIAAVSDTGIMKHGVALSPAEQMPKICIVDNDLAVAFAGEPDLAVRALIEFPRENAATFSAVCEYFLTRHREFDCGVDFVLMFNRPVVKIAKISENRLTRGIESAWIGDHEGFEKFQSYNTRSTPRAGASALEAAQLHTTKQSESHRDNETFPLLGSLRRVVLDADVPSVFGNCVAVNNVDCAFEYRGYALVLDEKPTRMWVPPGFARAAAPELTELRSFAMSCFVTPRDAPRSAVAFHYARGLLTHLYWGDRGKPLSNTRIVNDTNIEDFIVAAKPEFGDFHGSVILRTAPPPNYGVAGPVEG